MRQIILDTETTGLDIGQGHRIIEIGCIELFNRKPTKNNYHQYIQPEREIDPGALEVHNITQEFLADKPRFADISDDLLEYLRASELIIHNAPFDVAFLNYEFGMVSEGDFDLMTHCEVLDTLAMARKQHPGVKNNLDALCKRYHIDLSDRKFHGALLDAELLTEVYLAMTGGQSTLSLDAGDEVGRIHQSSVIPVDANREPILVIEPTEKELIEHHKILDEIKSIAGQYIWKTR